MEPNQKLSPVHVIGALILLVMTIAEIFSPSFQLPLIGYFLGILKTFNFLIHEAGHFPFCMDGAFLCALGGTLGQLIVPSLLIVSAARQASITVWMFIFWLGQNLLGISVYMADARAKQLKLFNPGMLFDPKLNPKDHHDWVQIFGTLHLLWADRIIAAFVYSTGLLVMVLAMVGCFFAVEREGLTVLRRAYQRFAGSGESAWRRLTPKSLHRALLEEYYDLKLKFISVRWPRVIRVPGHRGSKAKQEAFFSAIFSMLGKLVAVDGKVGADEIEAVESFMKRELKASPEQRLAAFRIFRTAKGAQRTFENYATDYFQLFGHNRRMLENAVYLLIFVAFSDTQLGVEEEQLIKAAVKIFGLSSGDYRRLKDHVLRVYRLASILEEMRGERLEAEERAQEERREEKFQDAAHKAFATVLPDELAQAYRLLGCASIDSPRRIKQAYRRRAMECHPDRAQARGLSQESIDIAKKRFQELQEAYELILQRRGSV